MTFEEKQQQKQTAFHMSINSKASTYILMCAITTDSLH